MVKRFFFLRLIKYHVIKNLVFEGATKLPKKSVKFHSDWNVLSFFLIVSKDCYKKPKILPRCFGTSKNHSKLHLVCVPKIINAFVLFRLVLIRTERLLII